MVNICADVYFVNNYIGTWYMYFNSDIIAIFLCVLMNKKKKNQKLPLYSLV